MYNRPLNSNIPFKFDSSGYSPPDFNSINFSFDLKYSDLKASVIGMTLQRDYLKTCDTYVVGYTPNNIQIIRSNCIYGGIRDLGSYLGIVSNLRNLPGYIKPTIPVQQDISGLIKGFAYDQLDLSGLVKSWAINNQSDLIGYLRQVTSSSINISAYLHTFQHNIAEFTSFIKGWVLEDSSSLINAIKGTTKDTSDLSSYIKFVKEQQLDLSINIHKLWQQNIKELGVTLEGYGISDLWSYVQAYNYYNLNVSIRSTYLYDLPAFLRTIQPVDLPVYLIGWADYNLPAYIVPIAPLYTMSFDIYGHLPADLQISIQTRKAISSPFNISATISSYYRKDIQACINSIIPTDLGGSIVARGFSSNLLFKIYPKVVYVKTMINISYLEHRDLNALINFPCFSSGYRDLSSSLYSMYSNNLRFKVFGTDGSNVKNLSVFVNSSQYIVQDKIGINYFNQIKPSTNIAITYNYNKYYSLNTLAIKTTFSRSSNNVYTKYPGLLAINSAKRFEEAEIPNSVVTDNLYKIDRTNWEEFWSDTSGGTFTEYSDGYVFDGELDTYSSITNIEPQGPFSIMSTVVPAIPMNFISYKASTGFRGGFISSFILYVKTNEEDAWTIVDSYNSVGTTSVEHLAEITNFSAPIGFIDLQVEAYVSFYVYDISGFTNYIHPNIKLIKSYYCFEDVIDDDWYTSSYLNRVSNPKGNSRGSHSLSCTAIVPAYDEIGILNPTQLIDQHINGAQIDYLEYYYYLLGDNVDSPAIKLINYDGNELISITTHSGNLVKHTEDQWDLVGFDSSGLSLFDEWCRVRLDFNWEDITTNITWQCGDGATIMTIEDIPLNNRTSDICNGGQAVGSYVGNYYANSAFNNAPSSYFKSSLTNAWLGYVFNESHNIKTIRFRVADVFPYEFEIRAGSTAPTEESILSGTLLLSVDETANPGFWEYGMWRSFTIDNDYSYSVYWITSPTEFTIAEMEMFEDISLKDQNFNSLEVRLHNNSTEDSFANGWGGTSGNFYLDDFYLQRLNYVEIINTDVVNIPAYITGNMIEYDLSASITPYINSNYVNSSTKHNIITLKLKDNVEEWRKYVDLKFNSYIKSYYYFSGNQRAYKEFRDENWEVRIEGYSLLNLPKGVERTKVSTKYIFNLKNYKSIDEAIRDMIDRVTLLRNLDLVCSISVLSIPSIDLNCTLKVNRLYKSNRVLSVSIIGE